MIRIVFGSIIGIFGLTGLMVEIGNIQKSGYPDFFGLSLSTIFIIVGMWLFISGWKSRKRKRLDIARISSTDREEQNEPITEMHHLPAGLNIITITGIVISSLNVLIALLILISGGVVMTAFSSGAEPGWGLLGVILSVFGVIIIIIGIMRLAGYIMTKKLKKTGLILVIILETISLLYKFYFLIEGFYFLFVLPLLWSLFVIIYLSIHRYSFSESI